jgi:hypothetical protein
MLKEGYRDHTVVQKNTLAPGIQNRKRVSITGSMV